MQGAQAVLGLGKVVVQSRLGDPISAGLQLAGRWRWVQGGAGWRVGGGSVGRGSTTTTTSSQPTPPIVSSVSELGVGGDGQQSMAKRNDAAAPKLVQRGHAMTRLDSSRRGQPEHPEAGLHDHHPPARSRLLCLRSRRTQAIGRWEAALLQRRQKTRGQRGSLSNRPLCCSLQALLLGANHF